jgi:hypothetical protein
MAEWSTMWKLNFMGSKSREVIFKSHNKHPMPSPDLVLNNEPIPKCDSHKYLSDFSTLHIDNIVAKSHNKLNALSALAKTVKSKHIERMYRTQLEIRVLQGFFTHITNTYNKPLKVFLKTVMGFSQREGVFYSVKNPSGRGLLYVLVKNP